MKSKHFVVLLFVICLITSCNNNKVNKQTNNASVEHSYAPKYAKGFCLSKNNDTKVLQVFNPWMGASDVAFTYYLKPDADPRKMDEIKIPVKKAICLSTTHIAYIDAIDETHAINGVSGATYVINPTVRKGVDDKTVLDVGYEGGLLYETVVTLQPDVVFAYSIDGELSGLANKLNELGVKVVFLGDYLEANPLGKAEWLMVFASFFNAEEKAEQILAPIFDTYNELQAKVKSEVGTAYPTVMLNAPWKDSWFVPGGESYMVNLIKDAGANFVLADNDKRDSYPINIETAYSQAIKAEFWLNPNAAQLLDDVSREDARLADIPAFRNKKVYNNNALGTTGGGSDFWESGVINPHIILKDLIKIFHPQILPEHKLVYFHQLK